MNSTKTLKGNIHYSVCMIQVRRNVELRCSSETFLHMLGRFYSTAGWPPSTKLFFAQKVTLHSSGSSGLSAGTVLHPMEIKSLRSGSLWNFIFLIPLWDEGAEGLLNWRFWLRKRDVKIKHGTEKLSCQQAKSLTSEHTHSFLRGNFFNWGHYPIASLSSKANKF